MAIMSLAMSVCVFLGVGTVARAEAEELVSGYGFTSNNASGTISQIDDGVRISAKSATTGNVFDYTYDTPLSVTDLNVSYRLTTDTTRENGSHSRMNIYILPERIRNFPQALKFSFFIPFTTITKRNLSSPDLLSRAVGKTPLISRTIIP